MITVFRYEHIKSKKGPYNSYWFYKDKLTNKHQSDKHPGINRDTDFNMEDGSLSACKSVKDLRNWFKGYNTKIINDNFNLVKYTVSKIVETKSGKQVAFNPKHIIHREVINI